MRPPTWSLPLSLNPERFIVTKLIDPLSLAEYQALVAGIPRNCPNAIFMVAGRTFTAPQAVTFIGGVVAVVSATATAKTS